MQHCRVHSMTDEYCYVDTEESPLTKHALRLKKRKTCGDSTVNRSLIVMCEYIVNKSANGLGGKNRGTVYREKIPQFCKPVEF
jgi:hypothetical protein